MDKLTGELVEHANANNKTKILVFLGALFMALPLVSEPTSPVIENSLPAAGKRVRVTPLEYAGTAVYHSLYLPPDWKQGECYPVMIEYTGNYFPAAGSTGKVDDANLGYGLTAGKRFIWAVFPFVSTNHKENVVSWWGDEEATVAYCTREVRRICADFGGDRHNVFICGFSRGGIAINYIGLHDDTIASLWRGFIAHDHYDGVLEWKNTAWGSPLEAYQAGARNRLLRLHGRPVMVMQNGSTGVVRRYLGEITNSAPFTFIDVPIKSLFPDIPNKMIIHPHTDKWLFLSSETKTRVDAWLSNVLHTRL